VKATSAALIGDPSLNFTPVRMVKVSVLFPFDQAYLVASHGVALPLCSALTKTSGS
jgi:hypothetical protein